MTVPGRNKYVYDDEGMIVEYDVWIREMWKNNGIQTSLIVPFNHPIW
jgi:hypothetical protein